MTNIQANIQNKVTAVLKNIDEMKKQDKSYIAALYETELQKVLSEIELLEVKTQKELENSN